MIESCKHYVCIYIYIFSQVYIDLQWEMSSIMVEMVDSQELEEAADLDLTWSFSRRHATFAAWRQLKYLNFLF